MENINCSDCKKHFCSRYNLQRHRRNKHSDVEHLGAHLGAPGAHFGAPGVPGAHLGAPGAHLGAPGAPGAHLGAPGAHLGAPRAPLGAHLGAPGAHLGAPGAPGSPPSQNNDMPLLPASATHTNYHGETVSDTVLIHPFTMMITGPTGCGKTTFVKSLLQHHKFRIKPRIQRIIWLYRRWQPLYTTIQETVIPSVEFYQGIPSELENDDFLDSNLNNLVILDDLMSLAGKDTRITELFTEGSHHRSLSVIAINQNLYASKDPTQRRNSHYLVIFNNPVDKQSILTLARQMYPGKTDYFLSRFDKATKQPFGCLFIDLKPFTPEKDRIKYQLQWRKESENDLTNQKPELSTKPIKENSVHSVYHSTTSTQPVQITHSDNSEIQSEMADKTNSCDDCGLLFDTSHDVQRHVKRGWCTEGHELPPKRQKVDSDKVEENLDDNDGFLNLWQKARESNGERFETLCARFEADGETNEEARDMAEERIQPHDEKHFFQKYAHLIEAYILPLQNSELHSHILADIQSRDATGVSIESVIKRVLKKNSGQFRALFDTEMSDDESSDTDETDEDSGDDDDDEQ